MKSSSGTARGTGPRPEPLLERHAELAQLSRWAHEAREKGALVFMGGAAGIGKTSLVEAFLASRSPTSRVLRGACESLSTPRPMAPLLDLGDADPMLATSIASAPDPVTVYRAVLESLADRPGTLLVLEDLHWADDSTLDLLRYLARRVTGTRALVIATYRDDEVGTWHPLRVLLGDVGGGGSRHRMTLRPLSEGAVAELSAPFGVDGRDLWRRTGGNPFYVTEVLGAGGAELPATVSDAVLARASRLPEGARTLLAAIAVLDNGADLALLRTMAGSVTPYLDQCVESGMLLVDGGRVTFRHELARVAVAAGIPPNRRAELHGIVLAALRSVGASAATLAHHAEEAGDTEATRRHAQEAARQAARLGAHRQAADQYARAIRALPATADAERAELLGCCSLECALGDRTAEATADAEEALRLWRALGDRLREGDTLRWLARLAWMSERVGEADRLGRAAVALLEELGPSVALARAHATVAQHLATFFSQDEAQDWGRSALRLARQLGAEEIAAQASIDLGLSRALRGDPGGAAQMRSGVEAAVVAGSDDHAARGLFQLVRVASTALRHDDVDDCAAAATGFCAERGVEFWDDYTRAFHAQSQMHRGQWDAASGQAELLWSRTTAASPAVRTATVALTLGLIRLRRGEDDPDGLLDVAATRTAAVPALSATLGLTAARVEAAWLVGAGDALVEDVRAAWESARALSMDGWWRAELLWWLHVLGAAEADGDHHGFAGRICGGWRPAADGFAALGLPYHHALALAESAQEASLRVALGIALDLGALPLGRLVSRRLRALGARRIPRLPRVDQPDHGPLTPREREVLGLLVEGLRDAEVATRLHLSERTVNHHVSAVLRKLAVPSRAAAVARVVRERTSGPTAK